MHAAAKELYPMSFWAIPRGKGLPVMRQLNAFYALQHDPGLMAEALHAGVVRVALFRSSLTLSMDCALLDTAIGVVRQAAGRFQVPVDWELSDHCE